MHLRYYRGSHQFPTGVYRFADGSEVSLGGGGFRGRVFSAYRTVDEIYKSHVGHQSYFKENTILSQNDRVV